MSSSAPTSSARRFEYGFTLIELLVSLTILGVILALLGSGLRVLAKNWDANAERINALDMVSRAADILNRDAAGLQRVVVASGDTPHFLFAGTAKAMAFVTLEPPYPTSAGPYFVHYSVMRNGPVLELVRARAPYVAGMETFPGATPANRVRLAQGQYEYRFAYASKRAAEPQWLDSWPHSDELPELIQLQIIDTRRGASVSAPIIVAVAADAELTCLMDKAKVCSAKSGGKLRKVSQVQSGKSSGSGTK